MSKNILVAGHGQCRHAMSTRSCDVPWILIDFILISIAK